MSDDANHIEGAREPGSDVVALTGGLPPRNYEAGDEVARGGMGAVFYSRDLNLHRWTAMKVMLQYEGLSAESVLRFVEEAQITGQLEHPNIVPIHDLGMTDDGRPFYTMKLVKGVTLMVVLDDIKAGKRDVIAKYPLAHLLTIFQKVCDAVAFAHSKGVIHRDLKPENVMIGEFGEVLVMDWGLARAMATSSKASTSSTGQGAQNEAVQSTRVTAGGDNSIFSTMAGTIMGSPQFMAPEQAEGDLSQLDARTDIFALGGILYNILSLQTPFTGDTLSVVVDKVRRCEIQPIPKTAVFPHLPGGAVPVSLTAVVDKAMAWDQAARYQSVPELQKEIEAYQGGFATAAEGAGAWRQFILLVKRNKAASIGVAAAIAVGILFGTQAVASGRKAQAALAELRGTAPTFAAQARTLIEEQKFDEALEKVGFAIKLDPGNADYHLSRANILEALARLPEAVTAYRRVLELRGDDPVAKTNLELCEKLLGKNSGNPELTAAQKTELLNAILAQKRQVDAVPLSKELRRGADTAAASINTRLKALMGQPNWRTDRLRRNSDGTFGLDLRDLKVSDLKMLEGLPISSVDIGGLQDIDLTPLRQLPLTSLTYWSGKRVNIEPLRGLSLKYLHLGGSDVSDLRPLANMPLEFLDLSGVTAVVDPAPLKGLPLRTLLWSRAQVRSLAFLKGAPLEKLDISGSAIESLDGLQGAPLRTLIAANSKLADISVLRGSSLIEADFSGTPITNLSPLLDCPKLTRLCLPLGNSDLAFLKKLPSLQRILLGTSISSRGNNWDKTPYTVDFWKKDGDRLARQAGMEMKLEKFRQGLVAQGNDMDNIPRPAFDAEGQLAIVLPEKLKCADIAELRGVAITQFNSRCPTIRDLSPLAGAPLKELVLYYPSSVVDLAPLRGLPLEKIALNHVPVRDLSPLRGMPLRYVLIDQTPIADAAPLADIPTLEEVQIPAGTKNIEMLRKHPKIAFISYQFDGRSNHPAQTATEFWKEFDAKKAGGK